MIDTEACEKLCKVTAIFFSLGFHKSLVCFPDSSTQRNEFVSTATKSDGKMSKQHPRLALPALLTDKSLSQQCVQAALPWTDGSEA